MRTAGLVLTAVLAAVVAPAARSQTPPPDIQILSLSGTGQLTFTLIPGYTNYVVEWAPTPSGPWSSSWDGLRLTQPVVGQVTLPVPMCYRVVARGTPVTVPPDMRYVSAGAFQMGDAFGVSENALPVHTVQVNAFLMDRFEVTKELWDTVHSWALVHGYEFENPGTAAASDHPVCEITWYDAVKWCNARSEKEGLAPAYYTGAARTVVYRRGTPELTGDCVDWTARGYRLPTEAEWEKTARSGLDPSHFTWGGTNANYFADIVGHMANYWNSGDPFDNGTTPVGYYDGTHSVGGPDMQNRYGIYDLAGNVAELCWDRLGPYTAGEVTDPHGPDTGDPRVVRGGSWYDGPPQLRVSSRQSVYSHLAAPNVGLRCIRIAPH